jgi:prepilin-type N-terminal cleavage/methylation domain-containing protein
MRLTLIPKKSSGFTLMELMVAIAIVGVLSAIAVPNYLRYRQKGLIGAATGDLAAIQRKVQDLGHDTGSWPGGSTAGVWKDQGSGNEYEDLSTAAMGLAATDGSYTDWQGPYYTGPFQDPWGRNYFFDEDYDLNGRVVAAIGSYGPNGQGKNMYDDDDIILIIPSN